VEEDIGVGSFAIRAQEGLAEDEITWGPSVGHDVQYKLVCPRRPAAVACVSAVPPVDRNPRRSEKARCFRLGSLQHGAIDPNRIVHEDSDMA